MYVIGSVGLRCTCWVGAEVDWIGLDRNGMYDVSPSIDRTLSSHPSLWRDWMDRTKAEHDPNGGSTTETKIRYLLLLTCAVEKHLAASPSCTVARTDTLIQTRNKLGEGCMAFLATPAAPAPGSVHHNQTQMQKAIKTKIETYKELYVNPRQQIDQEISSCRTQ